MSGLARPVPPSMTQSSQPLSAVLSVTSEGDDCVEAQKTGSQRDAREDVDAPHRSTSWISSPSSIDTSRQFETASMPEVAEALREAPKLDVLPQCPQDSFCLGNYFCSSCGVPDSEKHRQCAVHARRSCGIHASVLPDEDLANKIRAILKKEEASPWAGFKATGKGCGHRTGWQSDVRVLPGQGNVGRTCVYY